MKGLSKDRSKTFFQLPKLSGNISGPLLSKTKKNMLEYPNIHKEYTCRSYGIYDQNLEPILQVSHTSRRQVASLTKMMTLLVSIRICKKFNVNIKTCYFRVSTNAANTCGTSAELESKEWITIQDLLYGLMLPSGNDAAICLAENFGAFLFYQRLGEKTLLQNIKSLDVTEDSWNLKLYVEQFVKQMNIMARQFNMRDTYYINPHGLDGSFRYESYATVKDMAIITRKIMDEEQCMKVINCKSYKAQIKITCGNGKEIESRVAYWVNTNKLLQKQGYIGAKTGQTVNAGSCLASIYQNKEGKKYIIIVLGCQTKESRFIETHSLVQKHI